MKQYLDIRFLVTILLVVIVMAQCTGCAVNGEWTRRDTLLEVAFQTANYADALSTADISSNPYREEGSPFTRAILGAQPDPNETYVYFATLALSHWLIARALPPKWRPWFQGGTTLLSVDAVAGNCRSAPCDSGNDSPSTPRFTRGE